MKYKVESLVPPRIYKSNNNKTYILPVWKEVPETTTMDQVEWIQPKEESKPIVIKGITWKPEMGENKYNTHFNEQSNKFFCGCPGFWRAKGECKHVKALKESQSV